MNIIYLLGAGRSGTTLIATVLNSHPKIQTIGEMHQFFDHIKEDKKCSCGESLYECEFWKPIVEEIDKGNTIINSYNNIVNAREGHRNIPKLLITTKKDKEYLGIQIPVFNKLVEENKNASWFLDSSKYISRYLLLKRSDKLKLKGIYVIRDVRGVVNSFNKQVQTPRSPLSSILYYLFINFFAQIVCWFDKGILKIKYEDFVNNPEGITNIIVKHVFLEKEKFELINEFSMPHIIGGNRMKKNKQILIKKDLKWKQSIGRSKQLLYYFLTLPLMIINKYKP